MNFESRVRVCRATEPQALTAGRDMTIRRRGRGKDFDEAAS